MSATATAAPPVRPGALVRVYIPAFDDVPSIPGAPCSYAECPEPATQVEFVGRCEVVLTCLGHRLWTDPED